MTSKNARLGLHEIPKISWKGQTFNQITSSLQLNTIPKPGNIQETMRAQGVPHIRREIASRHHLKTGNPRIALSIDEFTAPNGYIVSTANNCSGDVSVLDPLITNNKTDHPSLCKTTATCVTDNAKKRVRSAGMVKKNYNINRNNDHYCTSSKEYLTSRNKTFQQNQYAYLKQGNASAVPGTGLASNNIYSPSGLSHCSAATISQALGNNQFSYRWVDSSTHTVTIPDGTSYDVGAVNNILANTLIQNRHYLVNKITGAKTVTLVIAYDNFNGKIQLKSTAISTAIFPSSQYSVQGWTIPSSATCAQFIIPNNAFQDLIGFSVGQYPAVQAQTSNQVFESSFRGTLVPNYVPAYYKPNNPTFGVQGSVDGGSYTDRRKYNAIISSASTMSTVWGNETANALSYGVNPSGNQITAKLKYGMPITQTPRFDPRTGQMSYCQVRTIKGG